MASFLMSLDTSIVATYTFIILLVLFELGTLLCGAAVSSKMPTIGRAVAGIGGSGMMMGD
ncbi:hypothetical protein F5882DRAFT_469520 [Hyaloscypha sp. PMI_1271]|nr:hypothetical protein F5882DRAFT_469520 [Hyaloscypha sp. PMI_1271]